MSQFFSECGFMVHEYSPGETPLEFVDERCSPVDCGENMLVPVDGKNVTANNHRPPTTARIPTDNLNASALRMVKTTSM
jgi:hypothetical protein